MLKSWQRRLALVFCLILILAGAALLYIWTERAALAERVIGRALAERGVSPVSFSVGFIGFRSISLSDIEIGAADNPDATVDSVTVTYAPGELLSGRVRSVEIGEARLRIRAGDEGLSLGALDPLLAGGGEGGALELPPVHVEHALVTVETTQGHFLLSGSADLRPDGEAFIVSSSDLEIAETVAPARFMPLLVAGQARLDGRLVTFDANLASVIEDAEAIPLLHVAGTYDADKRFGTAAAEGSLSFVRDGLTPGTLSPVLRPLYLDVEGGVAYRGDMKIEAGKVEVTVDADLDKLALRQTAAGSAAFSGPLRMHAAFGDFDGKVAPYRIELKSMEVEDLTSPIRFAPVTVEGQVEFLSPSVTMDMVARSALPAIRGARLGHLTGSYDTVSGQGKARAVGNMEFSPGKLELQTILPMLKGTVTRMSGKANYTANATLKDGNFASVGEVTLSSVGFVASAATVEGVDGTVKLASLLPPRTQGVQTLKVKTLQAGVPLSNGRVAFDLDRNGLRIVDATWPFAEGKLVLVSSGTSISASKAEFLLTVQNVNLAALLELVDVPGLSATGHISGKVPIAIRNGDPVLLDGNLAAQEDGVIVYRSAAADAAPSEETKLLTDALRNFHYTALSGGLAGNANGDLVLRLALRGANPDLYDGYPFAINVKLEGSLAEVFRRGTVGFRPLELIKEHSRPAVTPPADKTEP